MVSKGALNSNRDGNDDSDQFLELEIVRTMTVEGVEGWRGVEVRKVRLKNYDASWISCHTQPLQMIATLAQQPYPGRKSNYYSAL